MLDDADKGLKKQMAKWTPEQRYEAEKMEIQMLIDSAMRIFFKDLDKESLTHEQKMQVLENKLKLVFGEIHRIMALHRGSK